MSRVLFHVQYLKGVGHLRRTELIAEAVARRGLDAHIVSGGLPLPGFAPQGAALHQLPPLQAGPGGFTDLRDKYGNRVDEHFFAARRDMLLDLFDELEPDVLVVESFPFGRRALAFELLPLLEAAGARKPRPAIACSVRDILQQSANPDRAEDTLTRLGAHFDTVLVHGDQDFVRLDDSFPAAADIPVPLHYTGFVAAPKVAFEPRGDTPRGEVVVSMGGGAVGTALIDAALAARPRTALGDLPWRLVTGPNLPDADFTRLARSATETEEVAVERFRSDFRRILAAAKLSVSYAGYNTATDLMRTAAPAVLVTFSGGGGETEQTARAARLEQVGQASVLSDAELTPERLAGAIAVALARPPRLPDAYDLEGAAKTAEHVVRLAAGPRSRA